MAAGGVLPRNPEKMRATPPAATWKSGRASWTSGRAGRTAVSRARPRGRRREGMGKGVEGDLREDLLCHENGAVAASQHHFWRRRALSHLPRLLAVTTPPPHAGCAGAPCARGTDDGMPPVLHLPSPPDRSPGAHGRNPIAGSTRMSAHRHTCTSGRERALSAGEARSRIGSRTVENPSASSGSTTSATQASIARGIMAPIRAASLFLFLISLCHDVREHSVTVKDSSPQGAPHSCLSRERERERERELY